MDINNQVVFELDDGRVIKIDTKNLGDPFLGNRSKIFFYQNEYLLKVLPLSNLTENIPSKFNSIKKIVQSIDENIRDRITYRGVPLAISIDFKNVFDIENKSLLLLFNLVKGRDLLEYLRGEPPLSNKRKNIYKQLIDILISIKSVGVLHSDLYPDNFLVGEDEKLYLINLYSVGIFHKNNVIDQVQWIYKPILISKEMLFPLPPEVKFSNEFSIYSDVWTGLYLLFFVLTGVGPLDFLSRNDHKYLQNIIPYIDKSHNVWPPVIPYNILKERRKYDEFYLFYKSLFSKGKLSNILIDTYIKGYFDYSIRPDFEKIKEIIDYELLIDNTEQKTFNKKDCNIENETEEKHELHLSFQEEFVQIAEKEDYKLDPNFQEELAQTSQSVQDVLYQWEKKLYNLPISTREYLLKIIKLLDKNNLYNQSVDEILKEIIEKKYYNFLINLFIENRDIKLIYLFFKFVETGFWDNLLKELYKLSEISGKSTITIFLNLVIPIFDKYKSRDVDLAFKDIYQEIKISIFREKILFEENKYLSFLSIILYSCAIFSFITPFILFFYFKLNYLYIVLFYPFLFLLFFSLIIFYFRMFLKK